MEPDAALSQNENADMTQVTQSNVTPEIMSCPEPLGESRVSDPPALIQPGPPVQPSTPVTAKMRRGSDWLKENSEKSKKSKMRSQQDSQSAMKNGALTGITKQSMSNGNRRNGRSLKKRRCDTANKDNGTGTTEKPQTSDWKNGERAEEAAAGHHPDHKSSTEHKNIKTEVPGSERVPARFKWSGKSNNGLTTISANPDRPIIGALKTSKTFTKRYKPTHSLIIFGNKIRAEVNPSAPCGALDEGEELELNQKPKRLPETPPYPSGSGGLFIKVNKQGKTQGGHPRVIVRYNTPGTRGTPLAVFGYKHQCIKDVLHHDKRFKDLGSFRLQGTKGETFESDMELSLLPEDTYTVIVPTLPEDKSLGTDCQEVNEPGSADTIDQPSTDPDLLKRAPEVTKAMRKTIESLRKDFSEYVKANNGRKKAWRNIREIYFSNMDKSPLSARTLQQLSQHSHSVAYIFCRTNGRLQHLGTCFILCKCRDNIYLCLTCHHVVKDLNPYDNVGVIFTYNAKEHSLQDQPCFPIRILSLHEQYDCAFFLVDTSMNPISSEGLLNHIAFPPISDAVSVIGHPFGQYKQSDINCSVISFSDRLKVITERAQIPWLVNIYNFRNVEDPRLLTYMTSGFYYGSSGSPVFNEHGQLVAMHQGGYSVEGPQNRTDNVIEFGRNIVDIIILGAVEIEELCIKLKEIVKQNESLQRYIVLGPHPDTMQPVIRLLLQLWGVAAPANESSAGGDSDMETQ